MIYPNSDLIVNLNLFRMLQLKSFDRQMKCTRQCMIISKYCESIIDYLNSISSLSRLDFLQRSIHSDIPTPSYASDMRILMENMQALNINHRQDDYLLSSSSSLKDSGFQGRLSAITKKQDLIKFLIIILSFRSPFELYSANISFESITEQCYGIVRCSLKILFACRIHFQSCVLLFF